MYAIIRILGLQVILLLLEILMYGMVIPVVVILTFLIVWLLDHINSKILNIVAVVILIVVFIFMIECAATI